MDLPLIQARNRAPVLYRIAKRLERKHFRGSTRLQWLLRHVGYLDQAVDFRLNESISVRVPIARSGLDETDVQTYETELMTALSEQISQLPTPVTLIDVGADIGLFSLKILAISPSVSNVIAFEPNSEGFPWLKLNFSRLPTKIQAKASSAAIADFQGRGQLAIPHPSFTPGIATNHTQFFLESSPKGLIEVTTLDSLKLVQTGSVVIKIDVEGGELAVLRGATRTIADSPSCLVVIEAHPGVVRRTGIDPVECLRLLASLRPFRFVISENGLQIGTERAVFEQIPPDRVYNVIAISQ